MTRRFGGQDLRSALADLLADAAPRGRVAVLFDHDHTAATHAAAELLLGRFDRLVLLTPRDIPGVSAQGVHRRLAAAGDRLETLRIRHILTGAETLLRGVALFTYATPRRPRAWDASALEVRGVTVLRVGDAVAPRLMMSAVRDGQWAGETVQESCNSPAVSGVLTSSCSHGRNGVADGSA